ncbi:MAG TPA: hypothetical protein VL225_18630 [Vicinamibacterales bacterium]|nr:hypothetical protein [Vicinamibacterales bacterium]
MFRSRRARVLAVCVLLAVIHTWPLARHPGRYSRNDNADTQLNEWILAWVAHQLPRHPLHLFEANIFYPAHDSLAFSEPLIVPGLMGAPLSWAGASPVLVYNLLLIAGFALTAFATFLLVDAWTGDTLAGLVAGSVFAFNTHTLTRLAHVQGVHLYGLPLALLGVDGLMREGSYRAALLLAAALAVLAYTSGYLIVFATVMIAIALLTGMPIWWPRRRAVLPALGVAALVAGIAILPVYLPYRRVALEQHMVRSLDLIKEYSATPRGYLAAAGRVHFFTWSGRFFKDPVDSFFPGVAVLALAAMAIVAACRRRPPGGDPLRSRVWMLVAIAAAGFLLSLGTATPFYGWLFTIFPPMQGLRAAARFGNLFLLAVAVLGGLGLAHLLPPDQPPPRLRPSAEAIGAKAVDGSHISRGRWLAILLVVIVNVEALRAPFTYQPFTGIPGLYKVLATEPGPVVLAEQPFFPRWAVFQNAPYVLASTAHWRLLMNGYSGYTPETYQRFADAFWYFPEEWAIKAMKDAGVTHVMVHPSGFSTNREPVIPVIEKRSDFELLAIGRDNIRLYRLKR